MRLLSLNGQGKLDWAEFSQDRIPPYAILSHTWGTEEVSFLDLINHNGENQAGYRKIVFCGEQAARDKLRYFWVDTCCIDKTSSAELLEAINSMFSWYKEAAKCYVYLADVSTYDYDERSPLFQPMWEAAFLKSRWFTRGWTLQELLALVVVEFFSQDWKWLGNKNSLENHIYKATGIAIPALRGQALSNFDVTERMQWANKRSTTRVEDKAYSLLGIFDINMSLLYGEGEVKALSRLRRKINAHLGNLDVSIDKEASSIVPFEKNPKLGGQASQLAQLEEPPLFQIPRRTRHNGAGFQSVFEILREEGRCFQCGFTSHWANMCYASDETVGKFRMFWGLCLTCGKDTHFARDCYARS